MTDELVAYLLDDLCPERRADVERRLETDAAWRREFERLQQCFAATGDPAQCVDATSRIDATQIDASRIDKLAGDEEPPQDLVKKTCCFVKRACDGAETSPTAAAFAAAFVAASPRCCTATHWSVADVAVGAGVLLALGMLMTPALRESRDASRRLVCHDNLRSLGSALVDYQASHGRMLPTVEPGQNAGIYALKLAQSGVVDPVQLAQWRMCPDSDYAEAVAAGRAMLLIPSADELRTADGEELALLVASMGGSYAYILGFYDDRGVYHNIRFTGAAGQPMLADAPRLSRSGVRSVNHGCGQYVLYQDMSAPYRANSDLAASLDNIFLNVDAEHAAGRGEKDHVLAKSGWGRDGRVNALPVATTLHGE